MDILQWHCGNFSCRQGGRCFIANAPPLNSSENYWMAFVTARSHQAELTGTTLEICDRIFIYLLPYKSGFVLQRAIKQQPFLTYQLQQEVPMQDLSSTPSRSTALPNTSFPTGIPWYGPQRPWTHLEPSGRRAAGGAQARSCTPHPAPGATAMPAAAAPAPSSAQPGGSRA